MFAEAASLTVRRPALAPAVPLYRERQHREMPRSLDRQGHPALVPGTGAGGPAREYLAAVSKVMLQLTRSFVVDLD